MTNVERDLMDAVYLQKGAAPRNPVDEVTTVEVPLSSRTLSTERRKPKARSWLYYSRRSKEITKAKMIPLMRGELHGPDGVDGQLIVTACVSEILDKSI